jgi:hypothetical protein
MEAMYSDSGASTTTLLILKVSKNDKMYIVSATQCTQYSKSSKNVMSIVSYSTDLLRNPMAMIGGSVAVDSSRRIEVAEQIRLPSHRERQRDRVGVFRSVT